MSAAIWLVVAWPLLLAIPMLRARMKRALHVALLPAVVLVLVPGDAYLRLPWFLFGTGFAMNGPARWMLAMAIAIWLIAMSVRASQQQDAGHDRATTLLLLTLAGNLGVVLTTDLLGFFSFSTLMAYGFYGLLVCGGNEDVRRAARLYVIALLVADLLLFEALIHTATVASEFSYAVARQSILTTQYAQLYIWAVLTAFVLKAGIWPFHLWLSGLFMSAPLSRRVLLVGVPVTMALLGAARWLPLGMPGVQGSWHGIQALGIIALLYALSRLVRSGLSRMLAAWCTVAVTGLFLVILGTGLTYPAIWQQYQDMIYPFIAVAGISLVAVMIVVERLGDARQLANPGLQRLDGWMLRAVGWIKMFEDRAAGSSRALRTQWRILMSRVAAQGRRVLPWKHRTADLMGGWGTSITMFVLLGLVLAWLTN